MNSEEQNKYLKSILRHIDTVRSNCVKLGESLIEKGEVKLGLDLISNGYIHDNSKLKGIEWLYLNDIALEMIADWGARANDIDGEVFGILTVIDSKDGLKIKCLCDCGNIKFAKRYELRNGKIKSCGCLQHPKGENSSSWTGFGKISGKKWSQIKQSAIARNIEFNLEIEFIWDLFEKQHGLCSISGVEISLVDTENKPRASLDRIDSNKGYVEGNVQWVHPTINYMKHTLKQNEFIGWCKLITNYNET